MEKMTTALTLPDDATLRREITAINNFQAIVRNQMIEGHDYGVIPGTKKDTLLKPGAEKIAKLLGLADQYDIVSSVEDWDKPLFAYQVKCRLVTVTTGITISEGLGECNSMESNYRYRESNRKCPACGGEFIIKGKAEYGGGWLCFVKKGGCGEKYYDDDPAIMNQTIGRVLNEDIYTLVNTFLKMAKKRSLIDAALSAGRLSDLFTQDMEDLGGHTTIVDGRSGEVLHPKTNAADLFPPAGGPTGPKGTTDQMNTTNPQPQQWNMFWREARGLGFDKAMVHQAMGIESIKDNWLPDGKTLRQALDLLQSLADAAEDAADTNQS